MTEPRDFRPTVFLPKTDFPMKAGLPQKEPVILQRWQDEGIYRKVREARKGREKFILHDGPPYANGDMHIGHALNHILKDMVCRTQTLLGKDAPYVPGWDCHGLPIEWKVEEEYRKKKKNKDEVPPKEFRAECRAYAQKWVDVQREQLKRLGINGDWDNPYLTMDSQAEGTIVRELLKFAESGQLYRGAKPVMWSPVEKTALAEAEVEYEDIVSTQVDVAFEIVESPIEALKGAYAVIWTTTPWTIPVNQALAYGPEVEYVVLDLARVPLAPELQPGQSVPVMQTHERKCLIASALQEAFYSRLERMEPGRWVNHGSVWRGKGSDLAGTIAQHPIYTYLRHSREGGNPVATSELDPRLRGDDEQVRRDVEWEGSLAFFAKPRLFLPGDFVTTDSGTGLVHMAPDHGEDDFALCKAHGIEPVFAVLGDGKYREDWGWLGGQGSVINPKFNAPDGPICEALREAGGLLAASADYKHSYPHSWRSKAKVIYRCTPQWFVPMDRELPSRLREGSGVGLAASDASETSPPLTPPASGRGTLRDVAIKAIANTRFVPEKGRNRIGAMVEGRPDWVLSRQRAWGVPITLFVDRKTGQYLADAQVNARIVAAVMAGGVDAWDEEHAQDYLGDAYKLDDYERVTDILDVWFDSGSTHAFVLESGRWPDLSWPANLYLEGSDQHRGWFQSSLLESCATRGRAPYDAVLTHGFTMDQKGMKMSKSLGNTISPIDLMRDYGADILRLWALSVDFTEDHRIGKEILQGVADQYRKLRNTYRYLLGALEGFSEDERLLVAEMPELEQYMLGLLGKLDATLRQAVDDFDYNTYVRALTDFCNEDLSAFFFDIRKDSLYCDAPTDPKRRAYRTVLDMLFHALVRYGAPVLVFTAEEVWASRYPGSDSVHLLEWPDVPAVSVDEARWNELRALRQTVNEAIEPLRREKVLGSGLEAVVTVPESAPEADLAELFITATVTRGQGSDVTVERSTDHKCGRCWRLLPEVAADGDLCGRCEDVVTQIDAGVAA
ncbi:isoleucine--tRNA ligase [Novosphingobium sp. CECT 9465]|uniref:isoleucine--tRNA ligase n=1 Tax=Novosphingobium sp. CECT 9465 TaxID=2829794 RepID=UPI001E4917A5|nr:isoleucine--tRNA ligase [Novosphingobium sp. CECT 9465]CAH0497953.1 Isoleucine--tRNA ligase [Novosphingobium sp. CECT 9465]